MLTSGIIYQFLEHLIFAIKNLIALVDPPMVNCKVKNNEWNEFVAFRTSQKFQVMIYFSITTLCLSHTLIV